MKEYRICMPLTVEEVSVFVFLMLKHTQMHTDTHCRSKTLNLVKKERVCFNMIKSFQL